MVERASASALEVRGLHVYYGQSHALQGVDLTLGRGVLSVVGRNGMGKTTLCKAIMGMVPVASGSIVFNGQNLVGKSPGEIARLGIGYVPQGRRLWRSLSVDEHLRLMSRPGGAWSVERIYATFPRLAERKSNGGAQLSGGEQQMLAISRALLLNPKLLVMDEPTEGLAPVIVDQVAEMLVRIGGEGDIDVLVIEQNIGVATSVSDDIAVMINGRVSNVLESRLLAADRELQQRLLGVGRHGHDAEPKADAPQASAKGDGQQRAQRVYLSNPTVPTRWSRRSSVRSIENAARTVTSGPTVVSLASTVPKRLASVSDRVVLVAGAVDRRPGELRFLAALLKEQGFPVRLVDLSDVDGRASVPVSSHQIENLHPRGRSNGLTSDRVDVSAAAAGAFERMMGSQGGVAGAIALAGLNDGAALAAGLRALPAGTPRLLLGPAMDPASLLAVDADILMLQTLGETYGLSHLNRDVLRSAAFAIAGMAEARLKRPQDDQALQRVLAVTRYAGTEALAEGVTTMARDYDILGFAADGLGSSRIPALAKAGRIDVLADMSMMDIADFVCGGAYPADRLDIGSVTYVGACGGLDMVRLDPRAAAAARQGGRRLIELAPGLTVVRVNVDEAGAIGRHVGARLNAMTGPARLYLPEQGLSEIGRSGDAARDAQADNALFSAIERTVRRTAAREVIRIPANVNDVRVREAVMSALHAEARPASIAARTRR